MNDNLGIIESSSISTIWWIGSYNGSGNSIFVILRAFVVQQTHTHLIVDDVVELACIVASCGTIVHGAFVSQRRRSFIRSRTCIFLFVYFLTLVYICTIAIGTIAIIVARCIAWCRNVRGKMSSFVVFDENYYAKSDTFFQFAQAMARSARSVTLAGAFFESSARIDV